MWCIIIIVIVVRVPPLRFSIETIFPRPRNPTRKRVSRYRSRSCIVRDFRERPTAYRYRLKGRAEQILRAGVRSRTIIINNPKHLGIFIVVWLYARRYKCMTIYVLYDIRTYIDVFYGRGCAPVEID